MSRKESVGGALTWKLFERFGSTGVQFILQIFLARLLSPEHYGQLSIMVIFTSLANVFIYNGFSTSLVQRKEDHEKDYSSVFWVTLGVAGILYAIIYFTAPLIASFYNSPEIVSPFRVLALMLFPGAFNSVQNAKASKEMQFKKIFLGNIIGNVSSGVIGVIIAFNGGGVWALVAQSALGTLITCVVMLFCVRWVPKITIELKRVGVLFSFGWKLLVSSLIDTLYQDLRSLVIGKKYDTNTLAHYNRGKQFPQYAITSVNSAVQAVMLPAMSQEQDEKARVKLRMRNSMVVSAYTIFPMMAGLAAVATPLVTLLLTEKWLPAIPYMMIYCFTMAFMPIHSCNLQAINAMGRSDMFLKLEIIKKVIGVSSLVVAVFCFDSPIAIAMTGIFTTLISCFINAYPNKKLINYSYAEQMRDILPAFALAIVMFVSVYAMSYIELHYVVVLMLQIFAGILVYIGGSVIFRLKGFEFLKSYILSKLRRRKANKQQTSSSEEQTIKIATFLRAIDTDFPVPLSNKQCLEDLATKFSNVATLCTREKDGEILALVAGYTENLENNYAYISVVGTLEKARGNGYAKALVCEFIEICRSKNIDAVHLYTVESNLAAVKMYESIGFVEWNMENEPRKDDLHLIYYIGEQ